ncbi:hypothetical protein [Bosea sp. (in: a-proteobacteria)]|uniref:hypothetical protein n=1 Tax=Bosea sp. (in: a-proteobacteria) TaxID=1871050 RepID=UPI001ACFF0E3|nr:hypothetical protein [Bosea sp. (in: a-proteobacteria)]MBN9438959.1 hypothetical protein [Bosea sp. (in: a-proteobacteria)]
MTATRFTFDRLAAAAEREVRFRERVYAGRVQAGKMSREKAAEETAMMKAIAEHLRAQAERDSLFGSMPR